MITTRAPENRTTQRLLYGSPISAFSWKVQGILRVFREEYRRRNRQAGRNSKVTAVMAYAFVWIAVAFVNESLHGAEEGGPKDVSVAIPSQITNNLTDSIVNGFRFTHPQAIEIELVAEEPTVRWPVVATWSNHGTLLVVESNWNRESVEQQLLSVPHRIVELADLDRDGHFETRKIIADKLSFTEGIVCLGDDLLVTAPPKILRLSDSDKDGYYESRSDWFDGKTLTYCANDLHGPWRGNDGWIYWTKSAFAEQEVTLRNKGLHRSRAAHLYRRHPEGGDIDRLLISGTDNLVDLVFTPQGERFFCATFLHHPQYGLRDGIAHAVYGSTYGKDHDVLEKHWSTGEKMKPMVELGPAAPGGLHYLDNQSLIDDSRIFEDRSVRAGNLISAQFNLQRIGVHRMVEKGGSYEAVSQTLIQADRIDFHPVDVLEEHDGSLLILDTGGWYDLCCPTSSTGDKVSPGGIYRISLRGKNKKRDGTVGTPNTKHNLESFREEVAWNSNSTMVLKSDLELQKFWAWSRTLIHAGEDAGRLAAEQLETTLKDQQKSLNDEIDASYEKLQACLNIASLYPDARMEAALAEILRTNYSTHIHRLAAETLGRIGNANGAEALFKFVQNNSITDRWLEHSIAYALIEIFAGEQRNINYLLAKLRTGEATEKRLAILVLDQLNAFDEDSLTSLWDAMSSDNNSVSGQAREALSKASRFNDRFIMKLNEAWSDGRKDSLVSVQPIVQAWIHRDETQSILKSWFADDVRDDEAHQEFLRNVITAYGSRELPEEIGAALLQRFNRVDNTYQEYAWIDTVANLRFSLAQQEIIETLTLEVAAKSLENGDGRERILEVLAAAPERKRSGEKTAVKVWPEPIQQFLVTCLEDAPMSSSLRTCLKRAAWSDDALQSINEMLPKLTPLMLPAALEALLTKSEGRPGATDMHSPSDEQIRDQLWKSPAAVSLSSEFLLKLVFDRSEEQKEEWTLFAKKIFAEPADIQESIDNKINSLQAGDAGHGYSVFRSAKAACSSCHRVGYVGGIIGPELTQIGRSRARRDLIEAILFPSRHLAQSFHSTTILTDDGRVFTGIIKRQNEENIEMICGVDTQVVVRVDEIESRQPSNVSLMPAGLEKQLTNEEFSDLIAFLEAAR